MCAGIASRDAAIRKVGSAPILAYPGAKLHRTGITEEMLRSFLDFGIGGLVCCACYHDEGITRFFLDWCDRQLLLIAGGSDNHGGFVGRELGVPAVDTVDLRLGKLAELYTVWQTFSAPEEVDMDTLKANSYEIVLKTVREWPPDRRFALVRDVINTLVADASSFRSKRKTLERALGLLATSQPAPSDVEVKQWLDEHRMEKYG